MSNGKSILNVLDFENRLKTIRTSKFNESIIRTFLVDAIADCPMNALEAIARAAVEARKAEMAEESEGN